MTQEIIVGLIVVSAALYMLWRVLPLALRQWLSTHITGTAVKMGMSQTRAQVLAECLAKSTGCGSCDTCGTCAPVKNAALTEATIAIHSASNSGK